MASSSSLLGMYSSLISPLKTWLLEHHALDAVGLTILTNLELVTKRTLTMGTSSYLDAFAIIPGMHNQLTAPEMSKGEYPACAAMTTGYVFRVENPATVYYLQSVGRTGQLTTMEVIPPSGNAFASGLFQSVIMALPCFLFLSSTIMNRDWTALTAVTMMIAARGMLTFVLRSRGKPGWFGAPEPGVKSDLLVLLSQDRWVRICGATDDVKAISSGTWLKEPNSLERAFGGLAKFLIFMAVAMLFSASPESKWNFFAMICINTCSSYIQNELTTSYTMHGRKLQIKGERTKYNRRLDLARELVNKYKRTDCFVGMGMIQPHQADDLLKSATSEKEKSYSGAVQM